MSQAPRSMYEITGSIQNKIVKSPLEHTTKAIYYPANNVSHSSTIRIGNKKADRVTQTSKHSPRSKFNNLVFSQSSLRSSRSLRFTVFLSRKTKTHTISLFVKTL